uniref:Exocyst complex component Sec6 n=1 Tax=Aureoumbra lagunensis TaxID=44058 RepID=A0A7S3NQL9_9STRA|mmetsp:Transcript_21035/g.32258  ORF Transcript_21035/g.32258 Transcript_21035/m.32258 type:complete len:913 (+) Transcript_21035:56-2794(+)
MAIDLRGDEKSRAMAKEVTDRLELLRERAKERAVARILKAGRDNKLQLSDVETLRREYTEKLAVAESDIGRGVTDWEQRIRSALRNLGEAKKACESITKKENTIERPIQEKESLSRESSAALKKNLETKKRNTTKQRLEELEEASTAIRNLRSLLSQLDVYAGIPAACAAIKSERRNDLRVKYRSAMELELWRASVEREVRAQRNNAHNNHELLSELAALSGILASHLASVHLATKSALDTALKTLEHGVLYFDEEQLENGVKQKTKIVAAAEIVEMHDLLRRRLFQAAQNDTDEFERLKLSAVGRDLKIEAAELIRHAARERAAKLFAKTQMALADEAQSTAQCIAGAAHKAVGDAIQIRTFFQPLLPPDWGDLILPPVEIHLVNQVTRVDIQDVQDAITLAHFFQDYEQVTSSSALTSFKHKVISKYWQQVEEQLETWFQRTTSSSTVRTDVNGALITTRPEDVFRIISSHIQVASAGFGEKKKVIALKCLEALRSDAHRSLELVEASLDQIDDLLARETFFKHKYDFLSQVNLVDNDIEPLPYNPETNSGAISHTTVSPLLSIESLCALANDALRVRDRMHALIDELSSIDKKEEEEEAQTLALKNVAADVDKDLAGLAEAAAAAAAALPFIDLREAIFATKSAPGTELWQRDDPDVADSMDSALLTLADYGKDLELWLTAPNLIHASFQVFLERLITAYVDSFISSGDPFSDADLIAMRLLRDQNKILAHFRRVSSSFDDTNLLGDETNGQQSSILDMDQVASSLQVLRDLANLVACADPIHISHDLITPILPHFKQDTPAIILALLSRHPQLNDQISPHENRDAMIGRPSSKFLTDFGSTSTRRTLLLQVRDRLNDALASSPNTHLLHEPSKRFKQFLGSSSVTSTANKRPSFSAARSLSRSKLLST